MYFIMNLPTSASNIINHLMVSQVLGLKLLFESEQCHFLDSETRAVWIKENGIQSIIWIKVHFANNLQTQHKIQNKQIERNMNGLKWLISLLCGQTPYTQNYENKCLILYEDC